MIEDQDDVALLPPSPRGDRNCCALTTTQTWLLTLEMPSVESRYSCFTAGVHSSAVLGDSTGSWFRSGRGVGFQNSGRGSLASGDRRSSTVGMIAAVSLRLLYLIFHRCSDWSC